MVGRGGEVVEPRPGANCASRRRATIAAGVAKGDRVVVAVLRSREPGALAHVRKWERASEKDMRKQGTR